MSGQAYAAAAKDGPEKELLSTPGRGC